MTRRTVTRVLVTLAIASAVLAVLLAATGGFSTHIMGVRLSAHGVVRPLTTALLAGALGLMLLRADERARLVERSSRIGVRLAPWIGAIVAAIVLVIALTHGTRSAGGSDTYAYVSQARLWLRGDLHIHQEFVTAMPWPDAEWTFSPLGYKPSMDHTIVSTVPPGLPLLMAAFTKIAGPCGPFLVAPLCAALIILLAYRLGARLSGAVTGVAAALIAATSPTLIFMSLWSMSDVPATAFWTAAILWAIAPRGNVAAALGGVAAGAAIVIRPNLAPLAIVPAALLAVEHDGRFRRVLAFGVSCLPFIVFIATFNDALYGSPFASGYGDTASLFSVENIRVNAAQFSGWLWQTQGPLVFLCVLAPLFRPRGVRATLVAFILGVFTCYLLYTPFHAWWFLRFVLPAFPAIFALAADAVWLGSARFGTTARAVAMLVFTLVCMDWGRQVGDAQHVLDLGNGEQKYADVGRFVARELPPKAVLVTVLHSGSVRYYSDRLTLRYDWLAAEWLDRAVAYLQSTGSEPYLLLEESEVREFREKFKGQKTVAALDAPPIATHPRGVYLFATRPPAQTAPRVIPRTSGCE